MSRNPYGAGQSYSKTTMTEYQRPVRINDKFIVKEKPLKLFDEEELAVLKHQHDKDDA